MRRKKPFVPPPVELTYSAVVDGNKRTVELPFVTGVFANFCGNDRSGVAPMPMREFVEVNAKNFDDVLASCEPTVVITLPGKGVDDTHLSARITLRCLEDFLPARIDPGPLSLEVVLNDPEFLQLEATWRGLFYLVHSVDASPRTKVKIFDATKEELAASLAGTEGLTAQNPLVRKAYLEPFGRPDGEPFGCFVGDYCFNQQNIAHTALLKSLADFSALALAPFIAGASPAILGLNSFQGFINEASFELPWDRSKRDAWLAWQGLRQYGNSRFVGLTLPRFRVREAYGRISGLLDVLPDLGPDDGITQPCYANAAFAMAANISRAMHNDGWPAWIRGVESGGVLQALVHERQSSSAIPEVRVGNHAESAFAQAGYMPVYGNKEVAAFIGAQSIHKAAQCIDPDDSGDEKLANNMPYVLSICRFSHYLKCLFRDQQEPGNDAVLVEEMLRAWLAAYVHPYPQAPGDELEYTKPISAAFVSVAQPTGHPNALQLSFAMNPHRGLYGMQSNLRVDTLLIRDLSLVDKSKTLSVAEPFGLLASDDAHGPVAPIL